MIKHLALCASLWVLSACEHSSAFYRVDPDSLALVPPTRGARPVVPPSRPYARLEFMALPSARSFLDQGIVTVKVVSGTVEINRAFAAARALAPDAKERWFASVAVPLSDTGVVKVSINESIIKGVSTTEKMTRIAAASQDLLAMFPVAYGIATTAKGAVELAAAMSGGSVDDSYVQTFDISLGSSCAEATATCLGARGDDTFVVVWGASSPEKAATLKLDSGVLRNRDASAAKQPGLAVRVTAPSLPTEIFSPEARASLESAATRDGGTIQEGQIHEELVFPPHRPALREFRTCMNAARASGVPEDGIALAVENLEEWVKSTCGRDLTADTLPCTAASRVVARHRSASPALKPLAAVMRHWQAASAQLVAQPQRGRDPCDALDSTRSTYMAVDDETDHLLADHPQLASTAPGLSTVRREATSRMRDLADACFALRLNTAAKRDPEVNAVLGSITAADVKRGSFYVPNRAAIGKPALDGIREAVRSARAAVAKLAPPKMEVPTIDWFVTIAETQCADAAAVERMLEKRGDAIVTIISSYLDDAIEAAKPHACEQDVAALLRAAKELETVPSDKDAVTDLAKKLRGTRDALLAAVRKSEELRRVSQPGTGASCSDTSGDPAAAKPNPGELAVPQPVSRS